MKIIEQNDTRYILRFERGEELIAALQDFCTERGIHAAWISALGAASDIEIAIYNLQEKKYNTSQFAEDLEILNVNGNISLKEGGVMCHAHGVFGRADMSTIGGHIMKCVISATCEVLLEAGKDEMVRELDDEIGLHLLINSQ